MPLGREFFEKQRLLFNNFFRFFGFVKHSLRQLPELQLLEDFRQLVGVGLFHLERFEVEVDGHIGADGGEELRHLNIFDGSLDLLLHLALEFGGAGEELLNGTELTDEFGGSLLTNAGTAGVVVGRITHEGEEVDDLRCR